MQLPSYVDDLAKTVEQIGIDLRPYGLIKNMDLTSNSNINKSGLSDYCSECERIYLFGSMLTDVLCCKMEYTEIC